ncbi:hypothetical protein Undi14_11890 [Undibacterium sp. 14-3-2]|uniref:PAAR domain-containing protein n=1 Tax=Undibacterium sp. 14-3-2 TaxID=2800129 RepID=UPI001906351F|nr:PAAR domain-containing protein [Undibacterium sp. 14-3-2]MBK1890735.1 hypothetical protein [Undibacterium sp. 14-3-2]
MSGVSRIIKDTAGGIIVGVLAPKVFVNGVPIAVKGAVVLGHGPGIHIAAVMVSHSTTVFAHDIQICRQGDRASCGHAATGSNNVFAG